MIHSIETNSMIGIVNVKANQDDLEQGNKLGVLGGDYLLSQACGKLAHFRKPEVSRMRTITELNYRLGCCLGSGDHWPCHHRSV